MRGPFGQLTRTYKRMQRLAGRLFHWLRGSLGDSPLRLDLSIAQPRRFSRLRFNPARVATTDLNLATAFLDGILRYFNRQHAVFKAGRDTAWVPQRATEASTRFQLSSARR
jgi:protein involved in temperature-dependent protein secretion